MPRYQDQPWMDPNYRNHFSLSPDPVGDAKEMANETQQQALSFTPAPEENLTPQIGELPPPPKEPPAIGGMGDNRAIPGMYGASDPMNKDRMAYEMSLRYGQGNGMPGSSIHSIPPQSRDEWIKWKMKDYDAKNTSNLSSSSSPLSSFVESMPPPKPFTPEQRERSTGGAYRPNGFKMDPFGSDPASWSPTGRNPKLGGDPNTWTPEWASTPEGRTSPRDALTRGVPLAETADEVSVSPGRITGNNPSVYGGGRGWKEPMPGSDPNTWSPTGKIVGSGGQLIDPDSVFQTGRGPKLGGDPNTWSPTGRSQVGGTLGNEPSPWDKFEPGYNPYDFNKKR